MIYLLIYLIDIKHVHSSLQYQPMITTNIGDYETIQHVSTIYLLIYINDIKHVHSSLKYQPMITTKWWLSNYTACKYNILINFLNRY